MKTILFYWSKGADTRVKMIKFIARCERESEPCYLNLIAENFKLSHVAIKKHLDLLVESGYVKVLNSGGKPLFLALSKNGIEILREFSSKSR
ncbi:ArsR family transcriptional regulator [Candidatus Micrarchaeota archaeon]|nr:ArsR family transcriptional regulator [Candidatus Micrarchaeota archaeon]